jgi:hypothetical protein
MMLSCVTGDACSTLHHDERPWLTLRHEGVMLCNTEQWRFVVKPLRIHAALPGWLLLPWPTDS